MLRLNTCQQLNRLESHTLIFNFPPQTFIIAKLTVIIFYSQSDSEEVAVDSFGRVILQKENSDTRRDHSDGDGDRRKRDRDGDMRDKDDRNHKLGYDHDKNDFNDSRDYRLSGGQSRMDGPDRLDRGHDRGQDRGLDRGQDRGHPSHNQRGPPHNFNNSRGGSLGGGRGGYDR